MRKILSRIWELLKSKSWIRMVLIVLAAIVVAVVLGNVVVGVAGVVGALFQGVFGGNPTDAPRRTGSGNIPNPPRQNPDGTTNDNSDAPGSPGGGPRRRRR